MEGRKFTIRVQESPEVGYTGQCMEIPGAISEGQTIEELKLKRQKQLNWFWNIRSDKNYKRRFFA